jgi:hypothetical protein
MRPHLLRHRYFPPVGAAFSAASRTVTLNAIAFGERHTSVDFRPNSERAEPDGPNGSSKFVAKQNALSL